MKITQKITFKENRIVDIYFNDVNKYGVLSPKEELELILSYKDYGDELAKNKLINHNLRFVISVSKKFQITSSKVLLMDLISVGNQGLIKAIEKFIYERRIGNIKAVRNLPGHTSSSTGMTQVIKTGDVINPQYKHDGNNLYRESCAGTCTSMFNPRWLEHYDAPAALILAGIAQSKGINPVVNSKEFIFSNFTEFQPI